MALRSSTVIAEAAEFIAAGGVLCFVTEAGAVTAGRASKAHGPSGWEINSYGPGGRNDTDDAFWSAHHLARALVRVMFDKHRVADALLQARCSS